MPHHIIDVVDPDGEYNLAIFLRQATEAISDIQDRSKLPVLVGGTGQYVWALLEGWRVPPVPPNPGLRSRLEERAGTDGPSALHRELSKLDPAAASRVDSRNVRRLIRALEVAYSAPNGEAVVAEKRPPQYETKLLGLTLERSALYDQIDRRVDAMGRTRLA